MSKDFYQDIIEIHNVYTDWLKELAARAKAAEQEKTKEARLNILDHCLDIARVEAEDLNDAWEVHRRIESLIEEESKGE